jgi:hypothetical protein
MSFIHSCRLPHLVESSNEPHTVLLMMRPMSFTRRQLQSSHSYWLGHRLLLSHWLCRQHLLTTSAGFTPEIVFCSVMNIRSRRYLELCSSPSHQLSHRHLLRLSPRVCSSHSRPVYPLRHRHLLTMSPRHSLLAQSTAVPRTSAHGCATDICSRSQPDARSSHSHRYHGNLFKLCPHLVTMSQRFRESVPSTSHALVHELRSMS